jgi:hypothetical protein
MIAARDCKDIPDLSTRLQDILINGEHLNFGEAKCYYPETEDILDQWIENNLFPELDSFLSQICYKNLGLIEGEDDIRFMKHIKNKHEVRDKKLVNIFPSCYFELHTSVLLALMKHFMNMMWIGPDMKKCFLTICKSHFQNSKRLLDHEAIHKRQFGRRKVL